MSKRLNKKKFCIAVTVVTSLSCSLFSPVFATEIKSENEIVAEQTFSDLTLIPQSQMTATASSEHPNIGTEGLASFAIDGNEATLWHTNWSGSGDKLPQHITLSLGGNYTIDTFTYLPRQGSGTNGIITKYELQVSTDGSNFKTVKNGTLRNDLVLKTIRFDGVEATHVRFVALEGNFAVASAAELNVYKQIEEPEVESVGTLVIDSASTVKVEENLELSIGLQGLEAGLNLFGGSIELEYDSKVFELNEVKSLNEDMMVDGKVTEYGKVKILIASLTGEPIPANENFISVSLKSKKASKESTISLTLGEFGDINGTLHNMDLSSKKVEVSTNETEGEIIVKPNKVTNLKVEDKTSNSVKLIWDYEDKGTAAVEFIIYKDGKEFARTKETSYKVDSLRSNTNYGFKVSVENKNGEKSKPVSENVRTSKK